MCGVVFNWMMFINLVDGNLVGNFYCDGCLGGSVWDWMVEMLDFG